MRRSSRPPQQQVRRVLGITGLIDGFSVYPSLKQAVSDAKLARPLPAPALWRPHAPRELKLAPRWPHTAQRASSLMLAAGGHCTVCLVYGGLQGLVLPVWREDGI
jgi:hypothetical protein